MTKLKELMSVSGLPGLYRMVANKSNGLIAEDLDTGKRKFLSLRKHQFSPLETIAIFTHLDSVPLMDVLQKMRAIQADIPPIKPNSSNDELRAYFLQVLPDHDDSRVFPRDIKKIIKWFTFLQERNLLNDPSDEEE